MPQLMQNVPGTVDHQANVVIGRFESECGAGPQRSHLLNAPIKMREGVDCPGGKSLAIDCHESGKEISDQPSCKVKILLRNGYSQVYYYGFTQAKKVVISGLGQEILKKNRSPVDQKTSEFRGCGIIEINHHHHHQFQSVNFTFPVLDLVETSRRARNEVRCLLGLHQVIEVTSAWSDGKGLGPVLDVKPEVDQF